MPDTTSPNTTTAPMSLAEGIEVLRGLDFNGFDYFLIGVATHLVLKIARGARVSVETLGDEEDEAVLDVVNELLESGYLIEVDGALFPARLDTEDPA